MAIVAKKKVKGWQHSSAGTPRPTKGTWVLLAVLCAGVAIWLGSREKQTTISPLTETDSARANTPAKIQNNDSEGDVATQEESVKQKDASPFDDAAHATPTMQPRKTPQAEPQPIAMPDEPPEPPQKPRKQGRIFKSSTEQVISGFANTKPGYPPPPIVRFPMGEDSMSILEAPIEINDDDDDKTVEIKENCARLKEEIRQFIAEGGTAENYLIQYHNELSKDYEDWKSSQMYVVQLLKAGDLEEARRFADEANAELSARGVRNVKLPDNLVRQLEEGL